MKMTKLSLIAAMAITTAFAGGDIAPVEPAVAAPVASSTTIEGKAVLYYYTTDTNVTDAGDEASSQLAAAITLDVTHKINDMFTANFSAVGYANLMHNDNYMESDKTGGFFNVANITGTFGDTTLVVGRQLISSPMVGGFDWLLAPGSFEAVTLVNTSIDKVTLVATYLNKWRENNNWLGKAGLVEFDTDEFTRLYGDNWAVGAVYSDAFDFSVWYYNVDAYSKATIGGDAYTQVYIDAGTKLSGFDVAAQYVETDYDLTTDSTVYGIKASTTVSDITLTAAYNKVEDAPAGFVGTDTLYTTSWNTIASGSVGDNYKIEASTEFSGLSASASYASYSYDNGVEDGSEIDVILGYGLTDSTSLDVIYSNTDWGNGFGDMNALEIIATYKF